MRRLLTLSPLGVALLASAAPPRDLPGEVMPDRAWDFAHLHLDVQVDVRQGTIEGTARHDIDPLGAPDTWVRLHQRGLDIRAVRVDGAEVRGWRLGEQTLDVPLPAGEGRRTVEIDYAARPETGLHFRGQKRSADAIVEVWSQGEGEDNRYWFPSWDYPNDRFTYSASITADSDLVALSNGLPTGREALPDGRVRWSYALERSIPNYLVTIAVGEYATYEEPGPVPLAYVVPTSVDEDDARRTFGFARPQMAWLEELLGEPYPYPLYRQVLVQRFLYGAMENATITTMDERFLLADDTPRDRTTESIVAHELAHQWFGDLLTCYGWRELWLNEGFATFYAARWMEHTYGDEAFALTARRWHEHARHDTAPLAPLAHSKIEGREHGAVYVRGASVLQMLRVHLGEPTFDAAIRGYIAANQDRFVESGALRRVFEDVSGMHLGWLFDQYVHGGGHPRFQTSHAWKEGELVVTVEQTTEDAWYTVPVEIEIGTDTDVLTRRVWLGEGQSRVVLDLKSPPRWVAVDPRCGVLAEWEHERTTDEWIAQLDSASACARLDAIRALGDGRASPEAIAALQQISVDTSRLDDWRAEALDALGELGRDAIPAIAKRTEDPQASVRRAAVQALGETGHESALPLLEAAIRREADPWVRSAAVQALADVDADRALPHARRALKEPLVGPRYPSASVAIGVLARHGSDRDLSPIQALIDASLPREVRHAAARGAMRLLSRSDEPEAHRAALCRRLEALLDDPDLHSRRLGVELLGQIGDSKAEARLRDLGHRTTVPSLAEAALDAAGAIRSRVEDPPSPKQAKSDAERLREQLDALEERLERIEQWR